MNIPSITELLSIKGLNRNLVKGRWPELYDQVLLYPPDLGFTEKLYWYFHGLQETPRCTCGKSLKFRNLREGYSEFCSIKCSNSNPDKKQKTKETCFMKYGAGAPAGNPEVLNKMRETCLERYGVDNYSKKFPRTSLLSEETKQKMRETCLERYGVDNVMKLKEFQDRVNFGKDYKEISKKAWESRKSKVIEGNPDIISIEDGMWICQCPHPGCEKCQEKTYRITAQMWHDRKRNSTEPCTILLPSSPNNNRDTSLELFVRRILDEYNISYITNDRSVLNGKELDIWVPDKNLAIECNGVFSHSSLYKDSRYHERKYESCKEQGIQLISIWEDWIKWKPDIVKSLVLSKLGIYERRIPARKCEIQEVKSSTALKFLDQNHIQGRTNASVYLGLYYSGELVGVMSFGHKRGCSGNTQDEGWDLSRFCTKSGIQIIGGASKLLKWFIRKWNPERIYSFSANDISDGKLYMTLGFQWSGHSSSYWYVDNRTLKRYHRSTFTRKSLIERGWTMENETEFETMSRLGYWRIYDSGTEKWVFSTI